MAGPRLRSTPTGSVYFALSPEGGSGRREEGRIGCCFTPPLLREIQQATGHRLAEPGAGSHE